MAVLVGDDEPASGSFPKTKVSFIAEHKEAGKILLKGTLVNFGQQTISQKKATQDFKLEPKDAQVITFEVSKQYCADWNLVEQNPMRFIWKSFDHIQTKLLSTWSRRFFSGKKSVGPREATTFHCFGRLLFEDVKPIIALSGYSGVFITPQGPDGGPDGSYRVIWLQTTQLEHASAIAKAQPSVLGLVRGKGSLGLRVEAEAYTSLRQAIEPGWRNDEAIRYQVHVAKRYVLSPVSSLMDRATLQSILNDFNWHALPMRQMGSTTWQIGASGPPPSDTMSIAGEIALITEFKSSSSTKSSPSAVLAAPSSVKREIDKQLRLGHGPRIVPEAPPAPIAQPVPLQCQPDIGEAKLHELRQEFQAQISQITAKVDGVAAECKATVENQTSRINQVTQEMTQFAAQNRVQINELDAKITQVASAVVSCADTQAMAKQAVEFRQMLAKRASDEPSPSCADSKQAKLQ